MANASRIRTSTRFGVPTPTEIQVRGGESRLSPFSSRRQPGQPDRPAGLTLKSPPLSQTVSPDAPCGSRAPTLCRLAFCWDLSEPAGPWQIVPGCHGDPEAEDVGRGPFRTRLYSPPDGGLPEPASGLRPSGHDPLARSRRPARPAASMARVPPRAPAGWPPEADAAPDRGRGLFF